MKLLLTTGLFTCVFALTACATPAANPGAESNPPTAGAEFEDKGEMLTGSRIPQKSTTHVLKRVGNADYKKAKQDANSGDMEQKQWGK